MYTKRSVENASVLQGSIETIIIITRCLFHNDEQEQYLNHLSIAFAVASNINVYPSGQPQLFSPT